MLKNQIIEEIMLLTKNNIINFGCENPDDNIEEIIIDGNALDNISENLANDIFKYLKNSPINYLQKL